MRLKLPPGLIPGLLVLLFSYTGFTKFFALGAFQDTLFKQPFPHALSKALTFIIPIAEVLTAVALLFEKTRTTGLRAAVALLSIFTLYIGSILLHLFHKIPCSCAGIFRHLSWQQHFGVNLLLTSLAVVALLRQTKQSIPSPVNLHV